MVKLNRYLPIIFYAACCFLFVYLILVPFTARQWAIFFQLLILAATQISLLLVLMKWKKADLSHILILSAAVGTGAYFIFHVYFTAAVLITILFMSLSKTGIEERRPIFLWRLFLLSAAAAFVYYLLFPISHRTSLFFLLLTELIGLLLFLISEHKADILHLTGITALFIGGAMLLTGLVLLVKPLMIWIFDSILRTFFSPVLYWLASVAWFVLNHLATDDTSAKIQRALQSSNAAPQNETERQTAHVLSGYHDYSLFYGLAIVAVILLILFLLFRKRRIQSVNATQNAAINVIDTRRYSPETKRKAGRFRRFAPPRDRIRRTVFRLQREAAKKHCGRYRSESLSEWLCRIGFDRIGIPVISGYNKVRYGKQELSPEEETNFFRSAGQIRAQIRDRKNFAGHEK